MDILKKIFCTTNSDEKSDITENHADNVENDTKVSTEDKADKIEYFESKGKVTLAGENFGLIGSGLFFECSDMTGIKVGTVLSYQASKQNGKVKVIRVIDILNKDCNNSIPDSNPAPEKIFPGVVTGRKGRLVTISSMEDIEIDLNKIETDFIPLKGDCVQLECIVETKDSESKSHITEVKKITPSKCHSNTGFVTFYDKKELTGTINKKIYFNLDCCVPGYEPQIKDSVNFKAIECTAENCEWRALKVSPSENSRFVVIKEMEIASLLENKNDIFISETSIINVHKIGDKKEFSIEIFNNGTETQTILCIYFKTDNSQINIPESQVLKKEHNLEPKGCVSFKFGFVAKFMGSTKELIIVKFQGFKIGRWVHIQVAPPAPEKFEKFVSKRPACVTKQMKDSIINDRMCILSGERPSKAPAFLAVKIPLYNVPETISSLVFKQVDENKPIHMIPPEKISKSLVCDLSVQNYTDRFHTLIYLEELSLQVSMQRYDLKCVKFDQRGDYLVLEILDLTERRPSIIIGDRVIATHPGAKNSENSELFEGFVHKTGMKHVYLKFATAFHEKYSGEKYSVQFHMSRTSFRKAHHAVDLAARNLGKSFLFPMSVPARKPQIELYCEDEEDMILLNLNNINGTSNNKDTDTEDATKKEAEKQVPQFQSKYLEIASKSKVTSRCQSSVMTNNLVKRLEWFDKRLNRYQKLAIINILKGEARPLPYLIFGPPGTGKTITLIETVLQISKLIPSSRLLVCAPSNSAADLIALRLIDTGFKTGDLVRMVAYTRVLDESIPSKLLAYCVTGDIARDGSRAQRFAKENGVDMNVQFSLLGRHKITVVTCMIASTLFGMGVARDHFTHIIIDEAGQASEPEVMIPLSMFDPMSAQVILAGDPLQLGPFVYSLLAKRCGYGESFFERLIKRFPYVRDPVGFPNTGGYDPRLVTRLVYNYRSLPQILHLPNKLFYNSELIPVISSDSGEEVDILQQVRKSLPESSEKNVPPSIVFHGVRGENYQTADSPSWCNPVEAAQVFHYVEDFYKAGINAEDIGIITPYLKQCQQIRSMFLEAKMRLPKVGSVEEFQGQEYKIIILSMVRSLETEARNDARLGLGFICSPPRLNVAITRARALLIIVGNPHLLIKDNYWRSVLLYSKDIGGYKGCDFPRSLRYPAN